MSNVQNDIKREFIKPKTPLCHAVLDLVRKFWIFVFFIEMAAILDYVKLM